MTMCGHNLVQLHLAAIVPFDMGNHCCTTKQHAYKLHKWSYMTMIQSKTRPSLILGGRTG
jgi:hypothetical protein